MTTLITATNIKRSYGSGTLEQEILKGIDMQVQAGEFVAIMGKSGAGKSTLLYQLSGLDKPTAGSVVIDGTDIVTLTDSERTAFRLNMLGFVFQDYALVPDLTAEENIMIPLLMRGQSWEAARSVARQTLEDVGLNNKHRNLPGELSGGEQQRVSIARAVAGRPQIIFADEPTANLDSVSGKQIINLLTSLNKNDGQTIVMVTHEREYAQHADRIVSMVDGKITSNETIKHNV